MSQSVRIRKLNALRKLFCFHKTFLAWRVDEDTQNGTLVYKVCAKCGRVKKYKYIPSGEYTDYEWSNIHLFAENKRFIRALVNDNFREAIK